MILYLIPARGGSKRLPGKNLRYLAGIPLVAHAIRRAQGAARLVGGESRIVVSTDSGEIAKVSWEWGAEVLMRPAELATDDTPSTYVVNHAINALGVSERLVLLQPTSPLALPVDVSAAVAESFRRPAYSAWTWSSLNEECPNGAVYVLNTKETVNGYPSWSPTVYVEMPASRSVDIDTEDDWHMAEALLAARPVAPFAGREIGPGHPCFIIAEAGINHGGDVGIAHALVDAAADAGADAVKFQAYNAVELAEPGPHRDLLSKCLMGDPWEGLKAHAAERGILFLCSVFDSFSADILDPLVPAFKIPSGEIINLPLLRHVASKGKPVILSTGMSTMREVAAAVDALEGVPLALLHCVSEYPAAPNTLNLAAAEMLQDAFGVPVGWSDHTDFITAPVLAVARVANIIEKHLKLDGYEGPDSRVSATPADFKRMVEAIRQAEEMISTGEKVPTPGELETAKVARRRDGLRRNAG